MIERFCNYIVKKMRDQMPEIDDEKAEVLSYGMQLIIGEFPKMFLLFIIGFLLGIGWYTIFAYVALIPYRASSGGFHLKSHLGCIIGTNLYFHGIIFVAKYLSFSVIQKYALIIFALVFGVIMVSLYAPADTENVPILSKKERKHKKILSYITLVLTLLVATLIQDSVISNILMVGTIVQTVMITPIAYMLTKNKYGYRVYQNEVNAIN